MDTAVEQKLLSLNREFYDSLADPFAETRATYQPGFARLVPHFPQLADDWLDVGCGEGRFGRFLHGRLAISRYVGVDFTAALLKKASTVVPGDFLERDMSRPGFLAGLGDFDGIVCLAAMQHIPGQKNRIALLREMKEHLRLHGRILVSNWQFMDSDRQRRKIAKWSVVGLSAADVEAADYLLTWQRDGFGWRYVCYIDAKETAVLAAAAGLKIAAQFRSDGKEGNLNLYTVFVLR